MLICGITGYSGNLGKKFLQVANNFKFIKFKGDVRKKTDLEKWLKNKKFDLIIHFAAIVPIAKVDKNYKKAVDVNAIGTKNIIEILKKKTSVKWFFFSSTSHVYPFSNKKLKETTNPSPITKYGKTKYLAEKLIQKELRNSKIKFCIGRIFSIIDNKNKFFFLNSLKNKINTTKKIIKLDNLNHTRDFLSTEQICRAILVLWNNKHQGIINIGGGEKTSLKKIALLIAKKYKKKLVFTNNYKTQLVADISKLKQYGFKIKKLNFFKYF